MKNALYLMNQFNEFDIDWMVYLGEVLDLDNGDILITEGEILNSIYFLLSGKMEVTVENIGKVADVGIAEVVGEISMIDSRPTTATVTALNECRVLSINHEDLEGRIKTYPDFGIRFYKALSTSLAVKMRNTIKGIEAKPHSNKKKSKKKTVNLQENPDLVDSKTRYNLDLAMDRFDHLVLKVEETFHSKI
jgi:CRP/FNR family transcriptional regulator, cyclic AMP receptor protein